MALMKKLFEQNRIDDAKKASEDAAYYDRLLKELGINDLTVENTENGLRYLSENGPVAF